MLAHILEMKPSVLSELGANVDLYKWLALLANFDLTFDLLDITTSLF